MSQLLYGMKALQVVTLPAMRMPAPAGITKLWEEMEFSKSVPCSLVSGFAFDHCLSVNQMYSRKWLLL